MPGAINTPIDILAAKARITVLREMPWWAPTVGRLRSEIGPTRYGTAHTTPTTVRFDPRFAVRKDGKPRPVSEFAWTWLHETWHHVCDHVHIGEQYHREWTAAGLPAHVIRHRMDLFGQAIDHVVNLALEEIIAEARVSHCIQEPADLAICKDHRFSRMSCHQILAILMCEHPDPVTNEQDGENGGASPDDMGGEYGPGSIGADPPGESAGEQQGSGSGQTPAPSQDGAGTDADEVRRQWKTASTMMAMMGQRAGKLPGCMKAMITELTTPRVDWRARLRDILTASHQAERSFVRYNRRDDDLPGWEREGCGGVVVVVDTSGSTWDVQKDFLSEIDSILADLRPETTYIVWADAEVHGCDEYRAGERLDLTRTQPRGGGGTSFAPAFDWVEEHHIRPEALIYLTDLEGGFPDEAPPYRVIWCVYNLYGSNLTVPFGEVIEVQPGKEK